MSNYDISNSSESLVQLNEAVQRLSDATKGLLSFRGILQNCVLQAFQKLDPELYISRLFVNKTQSASAKALEPTGLLVDVLIESLQRGHAPVYTSAEYGLYEYRNSTDEEDRYTGFDMAAVNKTLSELIPQLPEKYSEFIDQYWQGSDSVHWASTRRLLLRTRYVELFWRELAIMAEEGGLSRDDEKSIHALNSPLVASAIYGVSIELATGRFTALASSFVIRLNGQSLGTLIPAVDSPTVLYTPVWGIEKFASSEALHKTIGQRLTAADSRTALLKDLPIIDRENVASRPEIRYPRMDKDVFETCIGALLAKQKSDIVRQMRILNSAPGNMDAIIREIESIHGMHELLENANKRAIPLIKLISANTRPDWLKASSQSDQEIYASLERELLKSDMKLFEATAGAASLKDYVHSVVQGHFSLGGEEQIDPDRIFVTLKHKIRMGTKQIVDTERKTLTELFMLGVHERGARFEIVVEGQPQIPKITADSIESAIQSLDLRVNYALHRERTYATAHVRELMREVLGRKVALSAFAATLQKHITYKGQGLIQRYNLGDSSIETVSVTLGIFVLKPFKDIMAFRKRGESVEQTLYVLYAPGSPSGQDWFEFADLKSLKHQFGRWAFTSEGREYLTQQAFGYDRRNVLDRVSVNDPHAVLQEWWSSYIELKSWTVSEDAPLKGSINNMIEWGAAEEEVVTPRWFSSALVHDRQLLTRLSNESKVINAVSAQKLNVPSFQKFARDLVMKRLNDYLRKSGPHPDIDPDQVGVKLKGHDYMTLTQLFINWEVWRSDVSPIILALARFNFAAKVIVDLNDLLRTVYLYSNNGQPLGRLDARVISALIELLPGDQYISYLKAEYQDVWSPGFDLRADIFTKLKQNEMLKAALVQKMKGALDQERFNWLKGVIDDLDLDRNYSSYPSGPFGWGLHAFHLENKRIEGAYVFSRMKSGMAEHWLYLPGSDDEKFFRPLEQLMPDIRARKVRRAILDNVRNVDYQVVEKYVAKARLELLPTPSQAFNHPIDFFRSQYLVVIARFLSDVDHQTTSSSEAFWRDALIVTELAVDVISFAIPVVGLVANVLRITRSIVLGAIAAAEGNDKVASQQFAAAWRLAITLYVGKVAAIGAPVAAVGLLEQLKDMSELVSAVTGVPVGVGYLTHQISWSPNATSNTQIVG